MDSPSKKVRLENYSANSGAYSANAPASPAPTTRLDAFPGTPFEEECNFDLMSPTSYDAVVAGTPLPNLPTLLPSSKEWATSMGEASNMPDNFSFDYMSPYKAGTKAGSNGSGNGGSRVAKKSNGSLLSAASRHLETAPTGAGGGSGIAALSTGDALMDEEAQGFLSSSRKTLKERIKNASKIGGRATPDISVKSDIESAQNNNSNNNNSLFGNNNSKGNADTATGMKIGGIPEINISSQSGTDPECVDSATSATSTDGDCLLQTLTAAAESMKPSPSNRGHNGGSMPAPPSSSKKSGKGRSRSYNGVVSDTTLQFPPNSVAGSSMDVDNEHSNLSYETNSSGHSNSNSMLGAGSRLAPPMLIPSYNTPTMKLTSAMATASATKPVACNCKRSRCLKMYCDCFRLTLYCKETCRCKECANVEEKSVERQAAIDAIVDRNPEAFKPRVVADPASQAKGHLTGCHCRKSSCLKKYCECFTAAVPCAERCRCIDCKNTSTIYRPDLKPRFDHFIQPGTNRKDSVGSEPGNMDVMAAILNDKRQFHSMLSSGGKSVTYPPSNIMMMPGSSYYDPDMSNMSNMSGSLNYSMDGFNNSMHAFGGSPLRMVKSDSKLAFSSPKAGTDASSGANSNRSILDNEEAAEVLSVMNSPNNGYMKAFNPEEVFGKYRDNSASSVGSSSAYSHSQSHSHSQSLSQGLVGRGRLLNDLNDQESGEIESGGLLGGQTLLQEVAGRAGGGLGGLRIEVEDDSTARASGTAPGSMSSLPESSYSSPMKPTRRTQDNLPDVKSPLMNLAGLCEEEQRRSQFNSPAYKN